MSVFKMIFEHICIDVIFFLSLLSFANMIEVDMIFVNVTAFVSIFIQDSSICLSVLQFIYLFIPSTSQAQLNKVASNLEGNVLDLRILWGMMPSCDTISQILLPLSQIPPIVQRFRQGKKSLFIFTLQIAFHYRTLAPLHNNMSGRQKRKLK